MTYVYLVSVFYIIVDKRCFDWFSPTLLYILRDHHMLQLMLQVVSLRVDMARCILLTMHSCN